MTLQMTNSPALPPLSPQGEIEKRWLDRPRRAMPPRTHCKSGHPLCGDNVYVVSARAQKHCRTCRQARFRERVRKPWNHSNPKDRLEPPVVHLNLSRTPDPNFRAFFLPRKSLRHLGGVYLSIKDVNDLFHGRVDLETLILERGRSWKDVGIDPN